jgi:hypothetical protein
MRLPSVNAAPKPKMSATAAPPLSRRSERVMGRLTTAWATANDVAHPVLADRVTT